MTPTTTPISAAAEHEHYQNDNQDQFHGISPLMATALFAACLSIQRPLQCIVPDKRATRQLALRGVSNFAQSPPKFKRAMRLGISRAPNHRHLITERLSVQVVGFSQLQRKNLMTKLRLLAAAAVLSTVMVAPAMAQQYHRGYDGYRDRGPVDAAAGIAGAVVGTAAAIATSPFRGSYAYDNGYGYDNGYARRNGFVCQSGTWFRGEDGRRHLCQ
jgi:VanZ family protein